MKSLVPLPFLSSQPRTTGSFPKWKQSCSVPPRSRHGTAVSFRLVTSWRSYKSPSYCAFIFGALFSDWFSIEKYLFSSSRCLVFHLDAFNVRAYACVHVCTYTQHFVTVGEVQLKIMEKPFPKYRLAVYRLLFWKEPIYFAMSAIPEPQVFCGIFVGLIEPQGESCLYIKLPLKQKFEGFPLSHHLLPLLFLLVIFPLFLIWVNTYHAWDSYDPQPIKHKMYRCF